MNPDRNPIAESGIAELKRELLKLAAPNAPLDQALLSLAVRNLNNRVRSGGQSAAERLKQRDQITNKPMMINEEDLKQELVQRRRQQHKSTDK